ncbi:cytochrome c oxidase assembly factor CtaG [Bacillus salipaludis]|uniref:cytochrome c oxidase assembly factor CtaG n=1 Tax=Bacillus salipaludis TaxID=2547811 RepID=UPI002E213435|nr:cytochrome c oxidase assembly factor CtaG [Bacillus salipaludis]
MLTLDIFGFKALWSPYFLSILIAILVGYFLITIKFRSKFKDSEPLTRKQAVYFVLCISLLYTIKGSPFDLMGHLMFYIHATTMILLVFLVAPLFVLGIPPWLWRKVLSLKIIKPIFNLVTKPILALLLFNGFFSLYHIPVIFDHVMQNGFFHAGYSILLFSSAVCLWWSLICPLPELKGITGLKKVGYLFINGILLTPSCALIIFADHSFYATYSDPNVWGRVMSLCVGSSTFEGLNLSGPQLFSSMSLVDDQQLGGVIMKVLQEIIFAFVLGHVFFEWYRKDQAETEAELNKTLKPTLVE